MLWKRFAGTITLAAIASISAPAGALAGLSLTIPVAEDAAINASHPDNQLGLSTHRGGLFVGLDGIESEYSFFLKFNLPELPPGEVATRVTLTGYFTERLGSSFAVIAFEKVANNWTESTISANTQPASLNQFSTEALRTAGVTPGTFVSMNLTDLAASEFTGDRVMSLHAYTIDGRFGDLDYFASHEFDASKAFRLEVTTNPAAVPLPAAFWPGVIVLGCSIFGRKRRFGRSSR